MQERQMKSKEIDRKADKKQTTCIVVANDMQNRDAGDRIAILKRKVIALPPKPPKSELTPYLEIIAILIEIKNYSIPDVLEFLTGAGITTYRQKIEYFIKRCEQLGVWPTREQLLRSLGEKPVFENSSPPENE
jgi:hypothetical protein